MIAFIIGFNVSAALSNLVPLALHVTVVVAICDAANNFELETRRCLSYLKYLSPANIQNYRNIQIMMQETKLLTNPPIIKPGFIFNVDRTTLTSMAAAITTYLVVLIQFHNDEP
ncbi:unnamed protein product [Orchesella dallaii]|uniref:Uncharacterized protein n=1 Tax=Orchesella dallaii TaxID=48710 RepID=A0ABP1R473_9HEXA